jgi:hypothetical protein
LTSSAREAVAIFQRATPSAVVGTEVVVRAPLPVSGSIDPSADMARKSTGKEPAGQGDDDGDDPFHRKTVIAVTIPFGG